MIAAFETSRSREVLALNRHVETSALRNYG